LEKKIPETTPSATDKNSTPGDATSATDKSSTPETTDQILKRAATGSDNQNTEADEDDTESLLREINEILANEEYSYGENNTTDETENSTMADLEIEFDKVLADNERLQRNMLK
jgi:hypothetical protein